LLNKLKTLIGGKLAHIQGAKDFESAVYIKLIHEDFKILQRRSRWM